MNTPAVPRTSWMHRLRRRLAEDRHLLFTQPDFRLAALDYDGYWDARGGPSDSRTLSIWQAQRVEWLAPHLHQGDVVLDLGCGGSGTLNALRQHVDITGIGADVSEAALDRLRADHYEALKVDLNDRAALRSIPEVDYVLAFELLEHLPEPEVVLASLLPRVRKGIWVSFPNTGYWAYRLRLLMGRTPMQWIRHPGEHLRFWTLRDLRWWASVLDRDLGVSLQYLRVYRGPSPLNRLWPGLFGMAFMFLLVRGERTQ
jgi:methionine biosynthesis protein MetW